MRYLVCYALIASLFSSRDIFAEPLASDPLKLDRITWKASGARGAVVAGGAEAVHAGLNILQQAGNAADAAAAVILALSVTDSKAFCFGGEVPILVYDGPRHVVEVVGGQGEAPRLATRTYFQEKGRLPGNGDIEAATVPAVLDAITTLLDRFGTKSFAEIAAPTLSILDRHEEKWHRDMAETLRCLVDAEKNSANDRSRGLRSVTDYFYRGPIARKIDEWSQQNGGLLRYSDLATHITRIEDPVSVPYRGYTVYKCGPWTQGPFLLESLKLLEKYDVQSMGHNRPATIHVLAEVMKLAFADRDVYFGDPLFVSVPLQQLLSSSYTDERRKLIDLNHASLEQRPGDPRACKALLKDFSDGRSTGGRDTDTTTCLVVDGMGNMVAATPSGWGGVLVDGTGIWLGSRLQSFNLCKDHPNCIEPGKRPRITLTPTLVLNDDKPFLAVSVAGGDQQEQATLQLLVNAIDFGFAPADAVTLPRFITKHYVSSFLQKPPELGSLYVCSEFDQETRSALAALGHNVQILSSPTTHPTMLRVDAKSGKIEAAGDPRTARHAAAF